MHDFALDFGEHVGGVVNMPELDAFQPGRESFLEEGEVLGVLEGDDPFAGSEILGLLSRRFLETFGFSLRCGGFVHFAGAFQNIGILVQKLDCRRR